MITLEEFTRFLREDHASSHVAAAVRKSAEIAADVPIAKKMRFRRARLRLSTMSRQDVSLQVPSAHESNEEIVAESKRVMKNFVSILKPYPGPSPPLFPLPMRTVEGTNRKRISTRKLLPDTISPPPEAEEIRLVEQWWQELERTAGYKGKASFSAAARLLVAKKVTRSEGRAMQLLKKAAANKDQTDFDVFRQLFYKGIFQKAVKRVCAEARQGDGGMLVAGRRDATVVLRSPSPHMGRKPRAGAIAKKLRRVRADNNQNGIEAGKSLLAERSLGTQATGKQERMNLSMNCVKLGEDVGMRKCDNAKGLF